jgi:hypothetical protein
MADRFAPIARPAGPADFAPTFLIAALDAARREAAAAQHRAEPDPLAEALAQARREGFAEGHAQGLREGAESAAAQAARAAAAGIEALRAGRAEAAAAAQAAAADVARLALAMLDAALPGLAAANGAALAGAFADRLRPMLGAAPEARLLVAPGLGAPTRALLGTLDLAIEEEAGLAPGDARAEWRSGGAGFELAQRRREIRSVLEAAGLGLRDP